MSSQKVYRSRIFGKRIFRYIFPMLLILVLSVPSAAYAQAQPANAQQEGMPPLYLPIVLNLVAHTGTNPIPTPEPPPTNVPTVTILAAGDTVNGGNYAIDGSCGGSSAGDTAKLLDDYPDAPILTLGDQVYNLGSVTQYDACYRLTWGQDVYKNRTHPTPGNHDYDTPGGAGYFGFFGSAAVNSAGKSWYSFDLGAWHIIELDSNCWDYDPATEAPPPVSCTPTSEQIQWLKSDLDAHKNTKCTLAFWHHPMFTSSTGFDQSPWVRPFWDILYAGGADVILNGHASMYERFNPQDPSGALDTQKGIVQFTAGTGGFDHESIGPDLAANEAVRDDAHFGVLKLDLHADSYTYTFLPVAVQGVPDFSDTGTGTCH